MKIKFLALFFLVGARLASGQSSPDYYDLVKKAFVLYEAKDYKASAFKYSEAFKSNNWKGYETDRYHAACSWAQAGFPDSAFFNLEKITTVLKYKNYEHIIQDKDLEKLHTDKRWKPLIEQVQQNKNESELHLIKPLAAQLDSIFEADQTGRVESKNLQQKYGNDSKEVKELWNDIHIKDSLNLIQVKAILDQYGWLGPSEVGERGNSCLFLVIQHADLKTQEHYLPMLQQAVKDGKARPSNLALLTDRIEMRNERPQIYGSQITTDTDGNAMLYKIVDEVNVNKRRYEVGLQPLEEYVKFWGIDYKLPEK